jgi:hypothetical protein
MRRSRVLIAAAVATGVLYLVGAVALDGAPDGSSSGAEIVAWFGDHRDAARTYAFTAAFGTLAFAVLAALIRTLLPAPHRSVFMVGAAAFVVETAVQSWFWGGLALHPETLQPDTARAILDVGLLWGPVLTGATMAMIGPVMVLGLRAPRAIPGWLTALGAVAFAEQAIETITTFGTHGFTVPGGDMNLLLGAGLVAVWLAGLVVWAVPRVNEA